MRPEIIESTLTITAKTRTVVDSDGLVTVRVEVPGHAAMVDVNGVLSHADVGFWIVSKTPGGPVLAGGKTKSAALCSFASGATVEAISRAAGANAYQWWRGAL